MPSNFYVCNIGSHRAGIVVFRRYYELHDFNITNHGGEPEEFYVYQVSLHKFTFELSFEKGKIVSYEGLQ